MQKYVVISTRPIVGSSRVCCAATTLQKAEGVRNHLETHEKTKEFGPFEVIKYKDAEKRKLYGE